MTKEQIDAILLARKWTFAKTMPQNPHEWSARKEWEDDTQFQECVKFIRANGYKLRFGWKDYVCYNIGEHRYWTMGNPIEETTIINRAVNK